LGHSYLRPSSKKNGQARTAIVGGGRGGREKPLVQKWEKEKKEKKILAQWVRPHLQKGPSSHDKRRRNKEQRLQS